MEPKGIEQIRSKAPFELPPLPYSQNALSPFISEKTISFHYGKHHKKYIDTTNELIKGTPFEKETLQQIITSTSGKADHQKIFNNAAQAWNHWFYWNSLVSGGSKTPKGKIAEAINSSFGSYDNFAKELISAAVDQFGSGWAWLVRDGGKLSVTKTTNANNPLIHGHKPIITIDVWEHAYYLDYQNKRVDYVMAVVENCINWDFAERNLMED